MLCSIKVLLYIEDFKLFLEVEVTQLSHSKYSIRPLGGGVLVVINAASLPYVID